MASCDDEGTCQYDRLCEFFAENCRRDLWPAAHRDDSRDVKRTDQLTTAEMYHLDQACQDIRRAFGYMPYLVGSEDAGYRDVDVRLMLDDAEFAAVCPTRERWEFLCLAVSGYLSSRTGLPVDFQIQRLREANERFGGKMRNPLGGGRRFAGGGDGTPDWDSPDPVVPA